MPLALFDLDNTLADRGAAFRRWLEGFSEHFGIALDMTSWLVEADGDGFVPRPAFLSNVKERVGIAASVESLVDWYDATYPRCYVYETASVVALQRLRSAGWMVGIVTNGRTAQQREKVERTGLGAVVDAVCVSEELGVRKPDAAIFREAAQRCGVALKGWMVGDAPVADIVGGAGVRLRTAWVARGRAWEHRMSPPNVTVATVAEAVTQMLTLGE